MAETSLALYLQGRFSRSTAGKLPQDIKGRAPRRMVNVGEKCKDTQEQSR
ncbi:hypothetical protein E2C01_088838 [Portunus trituberculatus]|uniref:Uncharacterized protein n=1 Tax=Portunus trituberculatus TaxID=210409 RepID=A0A5B7JKY5_PORTR|nr:hypothetical protein [Portunus trituberculatus]